MGRIILAATAMGLALAAGACHKTGSNAGKDLSNPGGSAPVNAGQDAAAGAVGAASGVTAPTSTDGFVTAATIGNMYEVQAGKIAEQRAKAPEVKAFARMMVADHTRLGDELASTLKTANAGVTAPTALDQRRKGMLDNLHQAGDSDFDLAYLHQQLAAHIETLELMKGYADHGDNAALKALAAKATPVIQKHLDEVKRIGGDKLRDAAPGGGAG